MVGGDVTNNSMLAYLALIHHSQADLNLPARDIVKKLIVCHLPAGYQIQCLKSFFLCIVEYL